MKKLMVAVALVAMAIGANAASVGWKTMWAVCNGTGSEDALTAATMAYLIDAEALTQAAIYDAVANQNKSLSDAVGTSYIKSASMSDGEISVANFTAFNAGDNKSLYMVLFDDGVGANGAIYFSEQKTLTIAGTGTTSFGFKSASSTDLPAANMTGFSASDGGWVAVPEPTSGLLLVLGMAGLMLRRRRA